MLFSLKNRKKEDKKQEEKKKSGKMEDFADDLDFPNDTPVKKSDRKQDSSRDFIADFGNDFLDNPGTQVPPRLRKTAGWSDETPGKKSWLRRGSKNFLRDSPKKEIFLDSSPITSDIPVIPDLDDMKEEELSADVAKAPSHTVSRIATYQELDSDLSKHAAFQSLDGIDLTLLTKRLLPDHVVRKEDETSWTWDTLFADISSHLNATMSQDSSSINTVDKIGDNIEKIVV